MSDPIPAQDGDDLVGPVLLQLILNLDGEALMLHAGIRPCVVTTTRFVELAGRPLSVDELKRIIACVLPADLQSALARVGSVRFEFPAGPEREGDQFTLIVTSRRDEAWLEILRHRMQPAATAQDSRPS